MGLPRLENERLTEPNQRSPNISRLGLLSLPPEVRQTIYENLLISDRPIENLHLHYERRTGDNELVQEHHPIYTDILKTCSLVYVEAWPILYRENVFQISCARDATARLLGGVKSHSNHKPQSAISSSVAPSIQHLCLRLPLSPDNGPRARSWGSQNHFKDWISIFFVELHKSERAGFPLGAMQTLILDFRGFFEQQVKCSFPQHLISPLCDFIKMGTRNRLREVTVLGLDHCRSVKELLEGLVCRWSDRISVYN